MGDVRREHADKFTKYIRVSKVQINLIVAEGGPYPFYAFVGMHMSEKRRIPGPYDIFKANH